MAHATVALPAWHRRLLVGGGHAQPDVEPIMATQPQRRMNVEEMRALPPVVDLLTAAAMLDVGRTAAYELVRTGKWPTPVFRLGGRIKVPTAPLLDLLGLSTDSRPVVPKNGTNS
jgi:hypothetical protein